MIKYISDGMTGRINKLFDGNITPNREMIEGESRVVEIVVKFNDMHAFFYPHTTIETFGFIYDEYQAFKANEQI